MKMKTLSEYNSATTKAAKEARERERDSRIALLASIEALDLPIIDASRRQTARELLRQGQGAMLGIACDRCGTQLVNLHPDVVLLSSPPQYEVNCAGCGAHGYMTA